MPGAAGRALSTQQLACTPDPPSNARPTHATPTAPFPCSTCTCATNQFFSPPTFPLQYLYMRHLRTCYLFRSCPQRFLDALLASARVEVFMPGEL